MTFSRRLRLFFFGVLIGVPISWYIIRSKKALKTPTEEIRATLQHFPLQYTKHALCRMECRNIDTTEIREVVNKGEINFEKSDYNATPCKKYSIETVTRDKQNIRVVFGICLDEVKVITAIDLNSEKDSCDCK